MQHFYIAAKNLKQGAKVFLFSTLLATVDSTFTQDTTCTVYNFEVEQTHNYFVGKDGVLVHNDCLGQIKKELADNPHLFGDKTKKAYDEIIDLIGKKKISAADAVRRQQALLDVIEWRKKIYPLLNQAGQAHLPNANIAINTYSFRLPRWCIVYSSNFLLPNSDKKITSRAGLNL